MADRVEFMSDDELRVKLAAHGLPVMPITATTRPLLVKKLKSVLANNNCQENCNHYTMADWVYSMSNAELSSKLAEYGYPKMPVTATTRKVLVNKLKSLIENNSMRRVAPKNTNNDIAGLREPCLIDLQFTHDLMPVFSLKSLNEDANESSKNSLLHNMSKIPPNQPEINMRHLLVPDLRRPNERPHVVQEVLQTSSSNYLTSKLTSALPTKLTATVSNENKVHCNRENAINMFQPEASLSGPSNYTFAPDLSSLKSKSKNINDGENSLIYDMIYTLTTQQDKGFQELLTNLISKMQDMFQNVSNERDEHFQALLSSINSAKQDVYQKLSAEQEKHFTELLTNFTRTNLEMVETLTNQEDKYHQELISSLRCTRDVMVLTITRQLDSGFQELLANLNSARKESCQQISNEHDRQFQELVSSLNFIKEQNDELAKRFDTLALKYDTVLQHVENLETENIEQKKHIGQLKENLALQESRACLSRLELKNIPKLCGESFETKEDLSDFVKKLGKTVGVQIETSNIRDIYRLYNEESSVVIEFTSVLTKEALLSALKKLKEEESKGLGQFSTKDLFVEFPTSTLFFSLIMLISTLFVMFILCIL